LDCKSGSSKENTIKASAGSFRQERQVSILFIEDRLLIFMDQLGLLDGRLWRHLWSFFLPKMYEKILYSTPLNQSSGTAGWKTMASSMEFFFTKNV
jgi:hypothetical protein